MPLDFSSFGPATMGREPSIRFFEKNEAGHVEPLPGEEAYRESMSGVKDMEDDLKKELMSDMHRTISQLGGMGALGAFGVDDPDSVAKDFEEQLGGAGSPEEMMERLDAYIKDLERQLEEKGFNVSDFDDSNPLANVDVIEAAVRKDPSERKRNTAIPQIPEKAWSFNQRKRITRLNNLLSRTTKEMRRGEEVTAKTAQSVWKAYSTARQSLSKSWASVPHEVWDLVWHILSADMANSTGRLTYLSLLARDMSEAKVSLSPSQQLVTMEAMFVDGWDTKAIDNWKRCMPSLGDGGADTFQEFWELGVRMFCQKGDLVQAERAVNRLLERQLDPRILMPYIKTCAADPTEEARDKAWDAYRRMKDLLGDEMNLEDYDRVISFFLMTNQTERALHAFVDMMTSGTVDLRGRDTLPSQIGNKFFFGKWLKRLIGAGDLDGAHSVINFMRSKGIEPAAIQVNGLVGAWQRSGGADNLQKADDLAWEMIDARVQFVQNRNRFLGIDAPARVVYIPSKKDIAGVPRATLETFSLLAENYRLRQLPDQMARLWDAFRAAEISPDAFMMNQLIESYSQAGNVVEARQLYRMLVYERNVKPDPHTFMALWKMLGANRLHIISGDLLDEEVHRTRLLFAETVRYAHLFEADGGLDGQLARKMLHTFRRLKDHAGTVLTLRAFRVVFKYTPPEALALEMMMETTNLAFDTPTTRQKLRLTKRKIDGFVEARQKQYGGKMTLDEMTPQQRGEEYSDYLQTTYLQQLGDVPDAVLEDVARDMGLYDLLAEA
ncbi:hypothetical protein Cob_v000926 [Colletotrichum orbiculare MAFF 240422]|uniref:Uncharacterized protein n=1 Tax=Colletotrichum orbiculare (strain 104-T / ATCC 96160 / CBS 514.97 / LARS 414 / MAFF 240422) TaxID=1213857 RepID=N4W4K9_COLOR|nr:hypothetical protein Cob_v000926 [Colletotrichum orbiculare MAFF 240422]